MSDKFKEQVKEARRAKDKGLEVKTDANGDGKTID